MKEAKTLKNKTLFLIFIFVLLPLHFGLAVESAKEKPENSFDKKAFIESAKQEKILRIGLVDCITCDLGFTKVRH